MFPKNYIDCKPKQFGDMHQRMKYLKKVAGSDYKNFPDSVWHAICDLETEVANHIPEHPPFGRRTVKLS